MFPNLFGATQDYWRKLDRLEARYRRGELSIEEVDAQVQHLMVELGEERRRSLGMMVSLFQDWLTRHRENLILCAAIALLLYGWLLTISV